jgi:4-hydroxythreonine-4-phosphate dehydrogenase
MLAEARGLHDVAMMFVGGGLRVALVTIHRSLRSVPDALTRDEVMRVSRLVHASCCASAPPSAGSRSAA